MKLALMFHNWWLAHEIEYVFLGVVLGVIVIVWLLVWLIAFFPIKVKK
jgi:hypothetical protein